MERLWIGLKARFILPAKMTSKNLFPLTQYLYKLVIITKIVHCTTRRNKIGVVAIQLDADFDPVNASVDGNSSVQWLFWLIAYVSHTL